MTSERINNLLSTPGLHFEELLNAPTGFKARLMWQKGHGYIIYYNRNLSESELYNALLHEVKHYERGDIKYNERNEYQTDIATSYDLVPMEDLIAYNAENPELDDYSIADHFNITIKQLHELVSAHYIKDGFTPPSGLLFSDYM